MIHQATLFVLLFLPLYCGLQATQLQPWFGRYLLIETRYAIEEQIYSSVQAKGKKAYNGADLFFKGSAAIARSDIAAEMEFIASHCRFQDFGMDCVKLTGRYQISDDIVGDALSVIPGVTLSQVFKPGLRNLSSFHHGGFEGEAFVSVGREHVVEQFWLSRYWGLIGMGTADVGSPWVRTICAWEMNCWNMHQLKVAMHTLWGLGSRALNLERFHGYGPINHQSIDFYVNYKHLLRDDATVEFEYGYRVYARNCPQRVNHFRVMLMYPMAL